MSEILLNVSYNFETDLNKEVSSLISQINASPPKIKVQFDTQAAGVNLKKQISSLNASIKSTSVGSSAGSSYMQGLTNGAKNANAQIAATKAHLNAVNAALTEINVTNRNITSAYSNLSKALGGSSATGQDASALEALKSKYLELQNAVETVRTSKASATTEDINDIYRLQSEMQDLIETIQKYVAAAEAEANAEEIAAKARKEKADQTAAADRVEKNYADTMGRLQKALRDYTAAKVSNNTTSRDSYAAIQNEADALENAFISYKNGSISIEELKSKIISANAIWASNTQTIKTNDDAHKTLGERMGSLASKFSSWLTVSQLIMYAVNSMRKMVTASIELDTAMTELKKVTDESDASYSKFLTNAETRAKSIGSSLTDIVNATADFARLGYNIEEASELADAATIYSNVGDDVENISAASESIIATMQAFGIDAADAMTIVDKYNEVGKHLCPAA